MEKERLDFLLVSHLPNVRYLCGFTGSAGALLVGANGATFFSDGRYKEQARKEVKAARIIIQRTQPLASAALWLRDHHRSRCVIGIEGEYLTLAARGRLASLLPARIRLKQAAPLVERARMIKDPEEIAVLQEAVTLGSSLFGTVLDRVRPGVRETEVAAAMEFKARQAGAEGMSFETIIASGPRSALPHGRASQAPIPRSGFVVCDFGVILAGYCSDMTRTVYVGRLTGEARKFYRAVQEAQQAALEAVRPGIEVGEVDHAARKVLKKAGMGRYFTHSTGHGVGLEIHEAPRVAFGQKELLLPGMVITLEPGAYVPNKWGVRIEDMVAVTPRGASVLTSTPKELVSL